MVHFNEYYLLYVSVSVSVVVSIRGRLFGVPCFFRHSVLYCLHSGTAIRVPCKMIFVAKETISVERVSEKQKLPLRFRAAFHHRIGIRDDAFVQPRFRFCRKHDLS